MLDTCPGKPFSALSAPGSWRVLAGSLLDEYPLPFHVLQGEVLDYFDKLKVKV